MIGVNQSYANAVARCQFDHGRCIKRKWFRKLAHAPIERDIAALHDTFSEIQSIVELLQTQQYLVPGVSEVQVSSVALH